MYILWHQPPSLYTSCNHWWNLCNKEENFWTILDTKPFVLITPLQVGILLGWDINQTAGLKLSIPRHSSLNHLVVYLCTMDVFPYCFTKCLLIIPQDLLITFHLLKFFLITLCPGPDSDAASTVLWISAFSPSKCRFMYLCLTHITPQRRFSLCLSFTLNVPQQGIFWSVVVSFMVVFH